MTSCQQLHKIRIMYSPRSLVSTVTSVPWMWSKSSIHPSPDGILLPMERLNKWSLFLLSSAPWPKRRSREFSKGYHDRQLFILWCGLYTMHKTTSIYSLSLLTKYLLLAAETCPQQRKQGSLQVKNTFCQPMMPFQDPGSRPREGNSGVGIFKR